MSFERDALSRSNSSDALIDGQVVNIVSQRHAVDVMIGELKRDRVSFLACTLNLDHLVKARQNEAFREAYGKARFVTADGFPIVLLARMQGRVIEKTTGADLIVPLCKEAAKAGYPVYFFGSTHEALDGASKRLREQIPALEVAGFHAPPSGFDPHSKSIDAIIDRISVSGARICMVALGAPLQELFSVQALERTRGIMFIGVGASLDFISGKRKRAPKLVQMLNAEWVWRMAMEPRRLGLRYARCGLLLMRIIFEMSPIGAVYKRRMSSRAMRDFA